MLDISCPGVYPGVLLWPICHPYMKALAPSRVENAPLTARLSLLFYFVRVDSDRHFSESMVLASLSPPPWGSPIRWVIPCSHVRVFARRLGR